MTEEPAGIPEVPSAWERRVLSRVSDLNLASRWIPVHISVTLTKYPEKRKGQMSYVLTVIRIPRSATELIQQLLGVMKGA